MNTELQTLQPSITEGIKKYLAQDLLKFKFYAPEKYEITNEEMVKDAEKNIKIATSEKNRILAETKEVKQFLDEQKKPVLEFEKQIESLAANGKKFFEDAIQVYKTKKAEEQRLINARINEIHRQKNLAIQAITNAYNTLNAIQMKANAMVQKWEIESAEIPVEETESAMEILQDVEMQIQAEPVAVEIVTQEKNFVQERLIEDKEEYSIGNEQEFIKWCFENNKPELLICKPSLSAFKQWVKWDNNKNMPFVKITVTKK